MAIDKALPASQPPPAAANNGVRAELDSSKLVLTLSENLKPLPNFDNLVFGETKTDHMLVIHHSPSTGWSNPEIKPYAPLSFDPMASCFQYCPNVFEGMKAYMGPNGEPRLFRPMDNMQRLVRSAERVALPPFDPEQLLVLIKKLITVESRWIPPASMPGYSLYIRPTMIGTRPALGVAASDSACLFVVVSPTGPYFRGAAKGIKLLAVGESVRSWPGGTGGHKLGLNYAPCFLPQRIAAKQGYEQVLWLLDDKITEAGAMNFFLAVKRDDGDVDLITPPLDGTILPGLTRASTITLANAHTSQRITLPGVPPSLKLHIHERPLTMPEVVSLSEQGKILEAFVVGTAVIVAPVGRIGYNGKDVVFPDEQAGLGQIGNGMWKFITDVQTGKIAFEEWSVVCE